MYRKTEYDRDYGDYGDYFYNERPDVCSHASRGRDNRSIGHYNRSIKRFDRPVRRFLSELTSKAVGAARGRLCARLLLAAGCIMCASLFSPYLSVLRAVSSNESQNFILFSEDRKMVQSQYGLSGVTDGTYVIAASDSDAADIGFDKILITDAGVDRVVSYSKGTVSQVIAAAGIEAPDNDDIVEPAVTDICTPDTHIVITRVSYDEYTAVETIPFITIKIDTPSLPNGENNITTLGSDGQKRVVYQRKWVNGVLDSEIVLNETITKEAVSEVIEVGVSKTGAANATSASTTGEGKTSTSRTTTASSTTVKSSTSKATEKTTSVSKQTTTVKSTTTTKQTTTAKSTTTTKQTTTTKSTTTAKKAPTTTKQTTTTKKTTAATEPSIASTTTTTKQTETTTTTTAAPTTTTKAPTTTTTTVIEAPTLDEDISSSGPVDNAKDNSDAAGNDGKTFVDLDGRTVSYTKAITGKGTAYTAAPGALTATGREVSVGLVAVDPKIIPYNSRLYIVSSDGKYVYGYAIAADTGSALRSGSVVVDLFYDTEAQCKAFGRRDVIVYVL